MVSVERTHLQMGLVEAQQEAKASPLDPWAILGQSKQAQSLQPHKSRTTSPQCFTVKKKGRMYFHLYSFEGTTRHSTPSLTLSVAKAENSPRKPSVFTAVGDWDTWSPLSNVHACEYKKYWKQSPPASPHGTIWRGREIQTLPPQPYTLTALHTFQELQMEPVRGNNQKRS